MRKQPEEGGGSNLGYTMQNLMDITVEVFSVLSKCLKLSNLGFLEFWQENL